MSLSISNNDYEKTVQINGTIIHKDENKIIVIMKDEMIPNDHDIFEGENLIVQTLDDQFPTQSHFIATSESYSGLNENQMLIEFTL
jgi:hypothetical protein